MSSPRVGDSVVITSRLYNGALGVINDIYGGVYFIQFSGVFLGVFYRSQFELKS